MSRCLALLTMLAFAAITANATPPPDHGGYQAGWGMNPTNWDSTSGSWSSSLSLYDPNSGMGGGGWMVGWNPPAYINYAPISLELWIEMNMILTYQFTSYQWHRLGTTGETITFTIDGTISSNNTQIVLMSPASGWDLTYMRFIQNNGVGDNQNARNLPLSWQVRWGSGLVVGEAIIQNWTNPYWLCGNMLLNMSGLPACDHWFQYKGTFTLNYHEADGYYKLMIAGCPYPPS